VGAAVAWAPEPADPFAACHARFEQVLQVAGSQETQQMKHSDLERLLAEEGQELMRQLYQACLDQRAQAEVNDEVVDAQGKQRTRQRTQRRELETIFGTVEVGRTGYGAEGEASLHPLDAQLNLPDERYSLEVRRRVALEASKNSFDETVETLSRYTGAEIGKRQVEELVGRAAQDFDAFYQRRHQQAAAAQAVEATAEPPAATGAVPADAVPAAGLLVITSDAKGVVMHRQDLRPATRKASERTPGSKLGTRLSKGEKRSRKRMATVAAVYSVAAQVRTPEQMLAVLAREEEAEQKSPRPRPQHKRVWASLEQEPREVLQEAFREALQRDRQGNQRWVAVVDGNKTQLTILTELAEHHGVQLTIVLDIFHVLEYLWKAGHALAAEGSAELEQWVLHRLGRVLEGRARHVAAGMRRSATKRRLATRKREPVDRCANYLLKYQDYLAYDQYLAAGFPIGSGVIEGACRHLVNDRLGITGARWRLRAAEAVLRLRALRSSGDFDDYWRFHEAQEWQRTHRQRYADGQVPALQPPNNGPRLRIVRD
jgi:hypothetical protein